MHRGWLLIFATLFCLSCGDSDNADCPFPDATCDTAAEIETLVRTGDTDAFLSHFGPTPFTCPGPSPTSLGEAFPLCEGAASGEVRHGHVFLNDSQGGVYGSAALRDNLSLAADREDSPARWRVVAISCNRGDADGCTDAFTVVLSPADEAPVSGDDPATFLAVAVGLGDNPEWRIDALAAGFFFYLSPLFFEGGVVPGEAHSMFEPGDVVTPWRTS